MKFFILFTLITVACANQRYDFDHRNNLNLINNNQLGFNYGPMLYNQNGYTMNNLDLNMRNHLYRQNINDDQILNNGYNFVVTGSHLDKHGLKNSLVLGGNAYTFNDNLAYDMKMPFYNMYNDELLKNSYKVPIMNKEPMHAGLRLNSGFRMGSEKFTGNNVYLPMPAIQAIPPPRNPVIVENILQQKLVSANLPVARAPIIRRVVKAPIQAPIIQTHVGKTHFASAPVPQTHFAPNLITKTHLAPAPVPQTHFVPASVPQTHFAPAPVPQTHFAPAPVPQTHFAPAPVASLPIAPASISKTHVDEEPIVQAAMSDESMFQDPIIQPVVKYANDRVVSRPFINMQHKNYLQPHETYER